MDNDKKRDLLKKIDHFMGQGNVEEIDNVLTNIKENLDTHTVEFGRFVLGYTGAFKKDLKEWVPLYDKIEEG